MCEVTQLLIGSQVGTFSFTTGVVWQRQITLIEWAKKDFDACFSYLFNQGREEDAELLFEHLVRITNPRPTQFHETERNQP